MAQPDLIGIVVRDMPAALRFYRLLGLDIPAQVRPVPFGPVTPRVRSSLYIILSAGIGIPV